MTEVTAVMHRDGYGPWATVDQNPEYTAVGADGLEVMELVRGAAGAGFLGADVDLTWRVCGAPGLAVVEFRPSPGRPSCPCAAGGAA